MIEPHRIWLYTAAAIQMLAQLKADLRRANKE